VDDRLRLSPAGPLNEQSAFLLARTVRVVSGVIKSMRPEPDTDVHIDLLLDPPYAAMINNQNIAQQHGWLVVEIVPADEPGCTVGQPPRAPTGTYDFGTCTGANISTPAPGSHVSVIGPYVLDLAHGWMEIHPAWAISPYSAASH
jgi:hypothetical protein